jgi:hypothetical protein
MFWHREALRSLTSGQCIPEVCQIQKHSCFIFVPQNSWSLSLHSSGTSSRTSYSWKRSMKSRRFCSVNSEDFCVVHVSEFRCKTQYNGCIVYSTNTCMTLVKGETKLRRLIYIHYCNTTVHGTMFYPGILPFPCIPYLIPNLYISILGW